MVRPARSTSPAAVPVPDWLRALLAATLLFNLIDLVLTTTLVTLGLASEANPLMAALLDLGPVAFAAAKIAAVSLGVLVLARFHAHRLARAGTIATFAAYGALMVWHLQSLRLLIA
jgi:Domain of unknown function (DUF5658)